MIQLLQEKTAKELEINSDAKFRFERGIDPKSIKDGLEMAAKLIVETCGGEVSNFDIQETTKQKNNKINFDTKLVSRTIGIDVKDKDIIKILNKLGFETKKVGKI